jgi:hypothetical protein
MFVLQQINECAMTTCFIHFVPLFAGTACNRMVAAAISDGDGTNYCGNAITPGGNVLSYCGDAITSGGDELTYCGNAITAGGEVLSYCGEEITPGGDVLSYFREELTSGGNARSTSGNVIKQVCNQFIKVKITR